MSDRTVVKDPEQRSRLHVRVAPRTHRQFKAIAHLAGETIEGRIERLMEEDIAANLDALTQVTAS